MGYTQGHDKVMFVVGAHTVMHDKYQLVIQHPKGCKDKGSTRDRRKTFHLAAHALQRLAECGEDVTVDQQTRIQEQGRQCAAAPR